MQSIYALIDPRDEQVRYVGRAQDVFKRYAQHLNTPHPNAEKNAWMDTVKSSGRVPGLRILEQDIEDEQADQREKHWIAYHLERGAPLTNIVLPHTSCMHQQEITPIIASATRNQQGDWMYPQLYYQRCNPISKNRLLENIRANPCVRQAIRIEPRIKKLLEHAQKQRCVVGYNRIELLYDYYKPGIVLFVGWKSPYEALRTAQHYDAVYEAIENLLPLDDVDLYPEGIMPNGMYSPNLQRKYGRESP